MVSLFREPIASSLGLRFGRKLKLSPRNFFLPPGYRYPFFKLRADHNRAANDIYDIGGCGICGNAFFSNGCRVTIDYVTGCDTLMPMNMPLSGANSSSEASSQPVSGKSGRITNQNYSP